MNNEKPRGTMPRGATSEDKTKKNKTTRGKIPKASLTLASTDTPTLLSGLRECPQMRRFLLALLKKHGVKRTRRRQYLKFSLDGYPDLFLYWGEQSFNIAQLQSEDESFLPDPKVIFVTLGKRWVPAQTQRTTRWKEPDYQGLSEDEQLEEWVTEGRYCRFVHPIPTLAPIPGQEKEQARAAEFCEIWAQRLSEQGWLEGASCQVTDPSSSTASQWASS